MATIPVWLIGTQVTGVIVTPLVSNASGVFSAASLGAQSFTALVDEIQYAGMVRTMDAAPVMSARRNPIVFEQDDTMVVTEIMRSAAGSVLAAACWMGSDTPDWARYQFSRGGNSIDMYGLMTGYEEMVTKGKSVARLTIRMVDAGAYPIYGAAFTG